MNSYQQRLTKLIGCGAAAGVIVGILALSLIAHLGFFWHLLHGSNIQSNDLTVPVPNGFFVSRREPDLRMWDVSFGFPLFKRSRALISLIPLPASPNGTVLEFQRDNRQFEEDARRYASQDKLELLKVIPVTTAQTDGVCVLLGQDHGLRRIARCSLSNIRVAFRYDGEAAFVPRFIDMVRGVRSTGEKRTGQHHATAPDEQARPGVQVQAAAAGDDRTL